MLNQMVKLLCHFVLQVSWCQIAVSGRSATGIRPIYKRQTDVCGDCGGCVWVGHDICMKDRDEAECATHAGWAYCGEDVDTSCVNIDCGTHGTCSAGSCNCKDNYMGALCDTAPDHCTNIDCGAHGICYEGVCICSDGYTGIFCETVADSCLNIDCGVHGTCLTGSCFCSDGYTGLSCGTAPDLCAGVECGAHGHCNGGICTCVDNYSGSSCNIIPGPCAGIDCGVHGTCKDGFCTCENGYTGTACEMAPDPCTSIDCGAHGYCHHGICTCTDNYSGVVCEITPGPCVHVDCGAHGSCVAGVCVCYTGQPGACGEHGHCDAGKCICTPGYTGSSCEIAVDSNIGTKSLGDLLSRVQFDEMFSLRHTAATCQAGVDLLTYESLIKAADTYYPAFANEGSDELRKREIAAFLGQVSQETSAWWGGQEYAWGLCFVSEVGCENGCAQYSDYSNTRYPAVPGVSYHGRGAIQISWNINYGQVSEALFNGDKNVLLYNPDLLLEDGVLAFRASLWFWMTAQYPKPSCHSVMIDTAVECPSAGRYNGFGHTTNIINGGLECEIPTPQKVQNRVNYYLRYTSILDVDEGEHLYCDKMIHYGHLGVCSS